MSDLFLDANICIYAFDKAEPVKQATAKALLSQHPCISSQVVIETFLACSRKLKIPQSTCEDNTRFLCDITSITPIDSSVFIIASNLKIGFSFLF